MSNEASTPASGSAGSCDSCGMPVAAGQYCDQCVDAKGNLQPFHERLEKMVEFQLHRNPGLTRDEAHSQSRQYMADMPAWRNHPELVDFAAGGRGNDNAQTAAG